MPKLLEYRISNTYTPFSLSPYDSDLMTNATVMEQIVGTLIKYGGQGRYEPYLAQEWHSSKDGRIWTFKLKTGLNDENGEILTSDNYVKSLKLILTKLGSKSENLPVFSKLLGWSDFQKNRGQLSGLSSSGENNITFEFQEKPDGFLEYLAMPYYGFFSPNDFMDKAGNWRAKSKLTSTGAYKINSFSEDSISLERRDGWFSSEKNSPEKVTIKYSDFSEALKSPKYTIFDKKLSTEDKWNSGFNLVSSTPTILTALVLSPFKKGLFLSVENRKLFYSNLERAKKEMPYESPNTQMANSFYYTSPNKVKPEESGIDQFLFTGEKKITVLHYGSPESSKNKYIFDLIKKSLGNEVKVEFVRNDRENYDLVSDEKANSNYDIRIAGVDIGGNIENWGIRMMFCSPLGVSFPDHSKKMCALVTSYENGEISDEEYPDLFNRVLLDDMTTLPLWHSKQTWLFSNDISLENVSPSMNMPRFDLLRLK